MKKYIPYFLFVAVVLAIVFVLKPSNMERGYQDGIADSLSLNNDIFLPSNDGQKVFPAPSNIKIFMENSASMDGYVDLNSEFKDALGKIIVKSHNYCDSTNLYFVNNAIYDVQKTALKGNVSYFISQLNAKTMKVGDRSSSNINQIFSMVLERTKNDTISILFSDFVYSIEGKNISALIASAKNLTMAAFMNALKEDPDFATIILKCSSQFSGKYYDRNNRPISYTGIRPYYIFIMGKYEYLKYLDQKLELNKSNTGIPGLTNKYLLSSKTWLLNEQTVQVLTTSYTNCHLIKPERNEFDIDFLKQDNHNDYSTFGYALNLNSLFVDASYLSDKSNYEIVPREVKLIASEYTSDPAALDEVPDFSSPLVLQFGMDRSTRTPNMKIQLINKIPSWVYDSNITDDSGIVPDSKQTFAIGDLIGGVYEAFKSQTSNKPIFEFEISINKYK